MQMKAYLAILGVSIAGSVVLAACGGGGEQPSVPPLNPGDFQATVDHPLFPLPSLGLKVFEGEERDAQTGDMTTTRVESRVLTGTASVAAIEVTVVQEQEYEDGELVESTLDYYAQHRDGTVYYFGERVDDYEGGTVVGHGGQWLAGEGQNQPGVFMPAESPVGAEFQQEKAPGVAEDQSKVVAVGQTVSTPAGSFTGCIKTEDFDPLGKVTKFKFYCPGVGLVREEFPGGRLDLISY